MTPFPYSVEGRASVAEARRMMAEKQIHHLPVVDGEELIGVVSDRDLRLVIDPGSGEPVDRDLSVREICETNVYVVELTERLDGVLDGMLHRRIGSAIVVKAGRIVGIFTAVDACRFLRSLLIDFFPTDDSHVA
jgi:acetoin utilization protein AcuB